MRSGPPPLKMAPTDSKVQNLLKGLVEGSVSVDEMMGSLDNDIDAESQRILATQPKPEIPPARLAQRYFAPPCSDIKASTQRCSSCATLDLQVRALLQSLVGMCNYFTNLFLSRIVDSVERTDCINMSLSYLQPVAHINEEVAQVCLALRAAMATVGELPDPVENNTLLPITLSIIAADGLPGVDEVGLADAYCLCEASGNTSFKFKTEVVQDSCNPLWNHMEQFEFAQDSDLTFTVFHSDVTGHDILGRATLTFSDMFPNGYAGELELDTSGLQSESASLTVKVEFPSLGKFIAWPPTMEKLCERLVEERSRATEAERRLEEYETSQPKKTEKKKPLERLAENRAVGNMSRDDETPPPPPKPKPPAAKVAGGKRVDPEDGQLYTAKELKAKYKDELSPAEIRDYWEEVCEPADEAAPPAPQRVAAKGGVHSAAPPFFNDGYQPEQRPHVQRFRQPLSRETPNIGSHAVKQEGDGSRDTGFDMWF